MLGEREGTVIHLIEKFAALIAALARGLALMNKRKSDASSA
jgi:hypothetical protein